MSIFDTNPTTEPAGNPAGEPASSGPQTPGVAEPVATPVATPVQPADAGAAQPSAQPASEPKYLSLDDYGDYLVKIKVDGQERDVPLRQARDGVMMQEAFTRRTQELASERRALHQANSLMSMLEADPGGTIQRLSEAYDLDPSSGFAPVQREPEEQALIQRQRALAAQQEQFQQQRINYEINRLINDYGVSEADLPSLADAAVRMNTDLETAYKVLSYERMQQPPPAAQAPPPVQRQQALDAQVVHSGASAQRGVATTASKKVESIYDAWELAKQELNL